MKTSIEFCAAALAISFVAGVALLSPPAPADEPAAPAPADDAPVRGAKMPASFYFTDEKGNRREPTEAELRQAAEALQRDLARLAGQHKGKHYVKTQPDGTVSATVALTKLEFLIATENPDGSLSYGHATVDEDGQLPIRPAADLPEM